MARALQTVVPSHLMDRALFPFETLVPTGVASEDGDKAFDTEDLPSANAFANLPPLQIISLAPTP
jgi:tRNA 2-thiocytidine biosynthesis protein TtcA